MKTIQPISIWDNGKNLDAKLFNAYAINVTLGISATFYYTLMTEDCGNIGVQVAQGNLTMTGEAYAQWEVDSYAWDWIAAELDLTITGDYIPPATNMPTEELIIENNV